MRLYARDIMSGDLVTLRQEITCSEAADIFSTKNISGAPVVDHRGVLIGVLTVRDILKAGIEIPYATDYFSLAIMERKLSQEGFHLEQVDGFISDYFSRDVHTAHPDTPVEELSRLMYRHRIHRIIIVKPDTEIPVGVVTTFDLLKVLAEASSTAEFTARER